MKVECCYCVLHSDCERQKKQTKLESVRSCVDGCVDMICDARACAFGGCFGRRHHSALWDRERAQMPSLERWNTLFKKNTFLCTRKKKRERQESPFFSLAVLKGTRHGMRRAIHHRGDIPVWHHNMPEDMPKSHTNGHLRRTQA